MIHRGFILFLTYRDVLNVFISVLLLVATCCLIRVGWMQSSALPQKQALAADSQVKEATRPILMLARADETLDWDDINQSISGNPKYWSRTCCWHQTQLWR
jgi:hypothetical protein